MDILFDRRGKKQPLMPVPGDLDPRSPHDHALVKPRMNFGVWATSGDVFEVPDALLASLQEFVLKLVADEVMLLRSELRVTCAELNRSISEVERSVRSGREALKALESQQQEFQENLQQSSASHDHELDLGAPIGKTLNTQDLLALHAQLKSELHECRKDIRRLTAEQVANKVLSDAVEETENVKDALYTSKSMKVCSADLEATENGKIKRFDVDAVNASSKDRISALGATASAKTTRFGVYALDTILEDRGMLMEAKICPMPLDHESYVNQQKLHGEIAVGLERTVANLECTLADLESTLDSRCRAVFAPIVADVERRLQSQDNHREKALVHTLAGMERRLQTQETHCEMALSLLRDVLDQQSPISWCHRDEEFPELLQHEGLHTAASRAINIMRTCGQGMSAEQPALSKEEAETYSDYVASRLNSDVGLRRRTNCPTASPVSTPHGSTQGRTRPTRYTPVPFPIHKMQSMTCSEQPHCEQQLSI